MDIFKIMQAYTSLFDYTARPWEHFEVNESDGWRRMNSLEWFNNPKAKYKMCINVSEIVSAETNELLDGTEYWIPGVHNSVYGLMPSSIQMKWSSSILDKSYLNLGLVYLDRKDAEIHSKLRML